MRFLPKAFLGYAVLFFMGLQSITRLLIAMFAWSFGQVTAFQGLAALMLGLLSDLTALSYVFVFLFLGLLVTWPLRRFWRWNTFFGLTFLTYVLLLLAFGELLFWEEFGERYNFIAVDYLIYTHEVLRNIWESYPMNEILLLLAIVTFGLVWVLRKHTARAFSRIRVSLPVMFFSALALILLDHSMGHLIRNGMRAENRYADALAQNGPYQFMSAFYNNVLDYQKHYKTLPQPEAIARVRSLLHLGPWNGQGDPIARPVPRSRVRHKNVIVIMVESLDHAFLQAQWGGLPLMPNMLAWRDKMVRFEEHYATGTRTVRGLEALSLAVPPTPGSSIVRRPHHANLYSLGGVLAQHGYQNYFIYGGRSYFDNMAAFFQHNHYQVIDQHDIAKNHNVFANAWGIADEGLFAEVLDRADHAAKTGQPFFMHVMTTSNHRPFTFPAHPELRLPMGSREAGVEYTDWALGWLLSEMQQRPWFSDTLLVITADHCASSAGKSMVDIKKYHIPWWMYAVDLAPKAVTVRTSQVDMAPTILGYLGLDYENHFFGEDRLLHQKNSVIALGTYQNLGFWQEDTLVVLSPQRLQKCFKVHADRSLEPGACSGPVLENAIAWYQVASMRYQDGWMNAP